MAMAKRYYLFKLFGFGVFLHQVRPDKLFHNHPWPWFSILFGSYTEERLVTKYEGYSGISVEKKKVRFFNCALAKTYHRISTEKPVWALCFHGRQSNEWSYRGSK